jgi:hypothetical protein
VLGGRLVSSLDQATAAKPTPTFTLHPNPAKSHAFLTASESGVYEVEVYNVMGQRVFLGSMTGTTLTLPTNEWAAGYYTVRVRVSPELTQTLKLIVTP